ncbi:hypothetical protein JRQ81_000508 [Phrynocephalus forsythii]|uniref:Small VCP/p97-interacting protein n=1 Tax=Phrynocephalus forsythii TaxID=171643 RepID=A0A9Q0Y696_9SAUR|nr:hypothetical protein JRQ81_000508 [Phrynocephalus forsythii]
MEAASRGIKNLSSVEQKKRKQEEMEKRLQSAGPGPEGGGLRKSRSELDREEQDSVPCEGTDKNSASAKAVPWI